MKKDKQQTEHSICEHTNERTDQCFTDQSNEQKSQPTNKPPSKRTNKRTEQRRSESTNGQLNKSANEPTNERIVLVEPPLLNWAHVRVQAQSAKHKAFKIPCATGRLAHGISVLISFVFCAFSWGPLIQLKCLGTPHGWAPEGLSARRFLTWLWVIPFFDSVY